MPEGSPASSFIFLRQIRKWLGLERNILVMLSAVMIIGMGEELWSRFVPKYLELLGAGVWGIALYGTLKDWLEAVYPYPGGWINDRMGSRAALIIFTLLAIVGYTIYFFSSSWQTILLGTLFVMAWSHFTLPAIFSIIGDNLVQNQRSIGFGIQSILKRIPVVLAPPLGGIFIVEMGLAEGIRLSLLITISLALCSIAVILIYFNEKKLPPKDFTGFADIWRGMDGQLKKLLVADCFARWAEGIPKVFVVLYVVNELKTSMLDFGWLTSVQMVSSILFYIPIAKLSDQTNRKPFVMLTFLFFAFFPLALVVSNGLWALSFAFAVAGLREIGEPARKALIVDLSNSLHRGRSVGMYYLIRGLVCFPASVVGGSLWSIDPVFPFYAAVAIGLTGCCFYAFWGPEQNDLKITRK